MITWAAEDTHEVEVVLHLRVPKTLPERHVERLRMALVTVAADMDYVIEVGVGPSTPTSLAFLANEVRLAADRMLDINTGGTWETFTCAEIEALADVFRAAGRTDAADFMIEQHGFGDYDPEDQHHEIYLRKEDPNAAHP